jgi:hypothetical protein
MKPEIGSHYSIRDQVHLWHFARTSGLPRNAFHQQRKGITVLLVFLAGVAAGVISGLIMEWLF